MQKRGLNRITIKPFRDIRSFQKRVAESSAYIAPKYNSENTTELLFRLHASVWPNVFPWCVANTAMAFAIHYSDVHLIDLSTSDKAHVFMSLMVSFLLVTRSKICLGRYMAARKGLSELMRTSKELIHHAVAFTRYKNPNDDGTKWRVGIANRTISILRVVVAILRFPSSRMFVCELSDIADGDRDALKLAVGRSNERSPHVLTLFLRSLIASHQYKISPPLEVPQEMVLHQFTSDFLKAYSNIMSNVATPYPFPLVQMTRTFLFVYVFSLPFALSDDIQKLTPYLIVVFFMTYGFIGLELINIEMDDPFGDDPNDFNVEAAALNAYKDILVCIEDIDGRQARIKVESNFNFTIRDRIRKTILHHRSHTGTRVPEWGGGMNDSTIDDISDLMQKSKRKRRNSIISMNMSLGGDDMGGLLKSIHRRAESCDNSTGDCGDNSNNNESIQLYYSPSKRALGNESGEEGGVGVAAGGTNPTDNIMDMNNDCIQSPMAFKLNSAVNNGIPEEVMEEETLSDEEEDNDDDDDDDDDDLSVDSSYADDYYESSDESNDDDVNVELYNDDNDDDVDDDDYHNTKMVSRTGESIRSDQEAFMSSLDQTRVSVPTHTHTESYSRSNSNAMSNSFDDYDDMHLNIHRRDSIRSEQRNFMAAVQRFDQGRGGGEVETESQISTEFTVPALRTRSHTTESYSNVTVGSSRSMISACTREHEHEREREPTGDSSDDQQSFMAAVQRFDSVRSMRSDQRNFMEALARARSGSSSMSIEVVGSRSQDHDQDQDRDMDMDTTTCTHSHSENVSVSDTSYGSESDEGQLELEGGGGGIDTGTVSPTHHHHPPPPCASRPPPQDRVEFDSDGDISESDGDGDIDLSGSNAHAYANTNTNSTTSTGRARPPLYRSSGTRM